MKTILSFAERDFGDDRGVRYAALENAWSVLSNTNKEEKMTYTVERVHSRLGRVGEAMFRLTYEITYVPELNLWRHVLLRTEELYTVSSDP